MTTSFQSFATKAITGGGDFEAQSSEKLLPSDSGSPTSGKEDSLVGKAVSFVKENVLGLGGGDSDLGFLQVKPDDWHKIFPYQFIVEKYKENEENARANPETRFIYTLPIPPESITVSMMTASQATPTLGGVIEETSQNVFWSIQLSGTTGVGIGRDETNSRVAMASTFRDVLSTTGLLVGIGNQLEAILGTASNAAEILNKQVKNFQNGGIAGLAGGAGDGLAAGFALTRQPELPYARSAVPGVSSGGTQRTNGYTEIHELHRFLYAYTKAKESKPSSFSLFFVNYKDSQRFQCVVKDVSFQKSMNEPQLYRYRIMLQCWAPTKPDKQLRVELNRFEGDLKTVNTLANSKEVGQKVSGTISRVTGGKVNIAGALSVF